MKHSIEWHERVLRNREATQQRNREEIERKQASFVREEKAITFHKLQIQEAKRKKKDGFDSEKFLKPRAERM